MELIDTLRIQQRYELAHICLYIVGSRNLHHELVAHFLQSECGMRCIYYDQIEQLLRNGENSQEQKNMILFDVKEQDVKRFLFHLEDEFQKLIADFNVALFNLEHNTGIESEALRVGVRGFFYTSDSIELFLKGVLMVSRGQLWVSREVLEKCVVENVNGYSTVKPREIVQKKHNLTNREVEILTLVTIGSKNDDIADKLCISPHTVKTHLYNVFKKINVADRLQAALWAAKNLQ